MSFNPNDVYTSSGSVGLLNCFTHPVSKYSTSSFYQWQEDNLPIYDLEERTYLNWQSLGFQTSSITGLALTVSADAPTSVTGCNSNIFSTVSAAIESLPRVLRFPVLIEVANFGNLGQLNLHGISVEGNGSLEIINRNFARAYSTSSVVNQVTGTYNFINQVSSIDVYNTLVATSALDISTAVFSASPLTDVRVLSKTRSVWAVPAYANASFRTNRLTVSLGEADAYVSNNLLETSPYEDSVASYDVTAPYDSSSYNQISNSPIYRSTSPLTAPVNGIVYNNYLSKVSVTQCQGPIYIRGFMVDGSGLTGNQQNGFFIENSHVHLENCTAVRCLDAGFKFVNSDVVLARGIVAYRNYGFVAANTRKTGSWPSTARKPLALLDEAAGLKAINSRIQVSATLSYEPANTSSSDFIFNLSRNANGIILENSELVGGTSRTSLADPKSQTYLQTELNALNGILLRNSILSWNGCIQSYNNMIGIRSIDSELEFDESVIENNQREGIFSTHSTIRYNKNLQKPTAFFGDAVQFEFSGNGQHLVLDTNSSFVPFTTSGMQDAFQKMKFRQSHGTTTQLATSVQNTILPSVEIRNASFGRFVHSKFVREAANILNNTAVFGACVSVRNSSKALFQGSKNAATVVVGPPTYADQKYKAAIYAKENSELEFNGPTAIMQMAVDILAEDNSIVNFNPPRLEQKGGLDISAFTLSDPTNHTSVELHSTKACLVATKGSVINMRDMGDFNFAWPNGANGILSLASGVDYDTGATGQAVSAYCYAGSMQFYPNPNDDDDYEAAGKGIASVGSVTANDVFSETGNKNWFLTDDIFDSTAQEDVSAFTAGGMCVRAVESSKVNVLNVNFPAGWWNPSGAFYDSSSANLLCDLLFIWNIADNSYLHASHCSVSGMHPQDSGYHGPSAVWLSGAGAPAYGAPPGTPDTSSLSVLDFFGNAGTASIWPTPAGLRQIGGLGSFDNNGPFRLYFSVDSVANFLYGAGTAYGASPQIFAQCYNPSGNLSATPSVSGVYGSVIKVGSGGVATTGFYYCSAILGSSKPSVILDESAANLFANAKNAATGLSGKPRMVSIYSAHKSIGGEASLNSNKQIGRGIKSSNVFDLARDN